MSAVIQAVFRANWTVIAGMQLEAASKNIVSKCSAQSSMDPFCIASAQSIRDSILQRLVALIGLNCIMFFWSYTFCVGVTDHCCGKTYIRQNLYTFNNLAVCVMIRTIQALLVGVILVSELVSRCNWNMWCISTKCFLGKLRSELKSPKAINFNPMLFTFQKLCLIKSQ